MLTIHYYKPVDQLVATIDSGREVKVAYCPSDGMLKVFHRENCLITQEAPALRASDFIERCFMVADTFGL